MPETVAYEYVTAVPHRRNGLSGWNTARPDAGLCRDVGADRPISSLCYLC
jgi:hypothetical protein